MIKKNNKKLVSNRYWEFGAGENAEGVVVEDVRAWKEGKSQDRLLVFDEFDRDACPWIKNRSLERSMIGPTNAD